MRISIRAARVNRDLTQEDVSQALGVSKKTVGNWESGKTMPKLDMIEPLCSLLGVKYDDINWQPRQ